MKIFSQRMTESLNHKGVCRTALASPGLLIIIQVKKGSWNLWLFTPIIIISLGIHIAVQRKNHLPKVYDSLIYSYLKG